MVEPYISTRIYETDNLISPSGSKGICQSPNATILSHLENNCKSFREIQSNNDLDGMSHNPLQKPQDTLISLPKEEIVDEYIIQKEPNQHVILEQTNKKMSQTRKLSDKFNSLGVIVPLKHGFDPQNSNSIKEEPNGQIEVDNRLHNEMNPLILTDERIIPKRSVSIIRKSDSIESPRKVSNQSTKTQQQLTPKPVGKRKLQQQQLNSGRKSMAIQSNSPNQTSVSPQRTRSGKVVPFGLNDDTGNERQSSTKQNMLGSMKKSIRFSGFGAEPSMQGSNATGSFKQQYPSGILISPVNTISPKLRDDRKVSPSVSPMLKSQTNENNGVANMIWKWGIASRVKMINRFYQRVKNQTSQLNFKFLQRFHYELIDDKAHFYDGSQVSSQSQSSKSQQQQFNPYITAQMCWIIQRYILNIPMLSANSRLLTIWRLIYSFLLVFQMFLVPFQICFDIAFNSGNDGYLLYYGPLIAYCFNILVQLNSGYYEMGQEQLDRGKVLQNYKYQFFIDLLAIFAFILTNTFNNPYFNICFYLKMNQLYTNISDIVEHFQINQKFSLLYTLSRLVFLILFLAHACGCVFLLISQSEFDDGNEQTWIAMSNIQYASTFKRYLNSLYFSVITMVTVGYGDIRPIADTEKMFVIFMALLGSVVFGYVVNTIGGIFQELAQKEADFKQTLIKRKFNIFNS